MRFRDLLIGNSTASSITGQAGIALLRVFAGLAMAFGHGLGKLPPSGGFVDGVAEMGFPFPLFFAWTSAVTEFFGGLLLALGLFTRPASLFLVVNMAVAGLIRHGADPFATKEKALLFLFIALMYALTGAGRYSVDALISRRPAKR